jgi:hypothetical protein
MTSGIPGSSPGHGDAIVVEFHKLRNSTAEGQMSAIHAGIQVADADARACEAALPAGLDAKPLQTPGEIRKGISSVHYATMRVP